MASSEAYVSVKINRRWVMFPADTPQVRDEAITSPIEVCAYFTGKELRDTWGVSADEDLWRECNDGHDDELIEPEETYALWDGDRFYVFHKKVNAG